MPDYSHLKHPPPRGHVLLLSCMDLRLLDNIVDFMNHDNLTNRYDQVVFAGAALGALGAPGSKDEHGNPTNFNHWKPVFFDHLGEAIRLHDVKDLYILEHRNCGAYHKVFHIAPEFDDKPTDITKEIRLHRTYANLLENEVQKWCRANKKKLQIHKFLMDLRGKVTKL